MRAHVLHADFFLRQFSIVICVEFLQRYHGVVNLGLINHAIFVGIQSGEGLQHAHDAGASAATLTLALTTTLSHLRTHFILGKFAVLILV